MTMPSLSLLDTLVAELEPVRPVRALHGIMLLFAASLTVCAVTLSRYSLRPDLIALTPDPMVVLRGGMLLILGTAAAQAAIRAARPAVGQAYNGWLWALAAALLFPVGALAMTLQSGGMPEGALYPEIGKYCLGVGGAGALAIGAAFTLWLRQGAVTAPERAGWLTGVAAGSFGTFAFSLHCPVTNIWYIGFWYALTVGVAALIGRILVPRFIRW